jgi:hypothetical protein
MTDTNPPQERAATIRQYTPEQIVERFAELVRLERQRWRAAERELVTRRLEQSIIESDTEYQENERVDPEIIAMLNRLPTSQRYVVWSVSRFCVENMEDENPRCGRQLRDQFIRDMSSRLRAPAV